MINKPKRNLMLGFIAPPAMIAMICTIGLITSTIMSRHFLSAEYWLSAAIREDLFIVAKASVVMLMFILLLSGLQSFIYSLIMNYLILPKVHTQFHRIWISGLLGGLAATGLIGAAFNDSDPVEMLPIIMVLLIIGVAVGLLSGWILSRNYNFNNPQL